MPTNKWGQAKRRTAKIRPKAVAGGNFDCFSNFDKCRSGVADEVISGVAVDHVGMDVRSRFMHHYCAVFHCILQQTGSN